MQHTGDLEPAGLAYAPDEYVPEPTAWDDAPAEPKLPLPLTLVLLTVFLPEGLSFFIAGLRLTLTRLIFLVIAPMLFAKLGDKIGRGEFRLVASDIFIPLAAVWMFLGPAVMSGIGDSLVHSGPVVLEFLIAYLCTRVLLSGPGAARAFVSKTCLVVAVVCLSGLLDTLTGRYFIRDLVGSLTGFSGAMRIDQDQYRFGLLRAAGPIEHAILYGFVSTLGLLLSLTLTNRLRMFCIGACLLGVVLSFSSAPEQCAMMGLGLLFYRHMFRGVRRRWLLLSILPIATTIFLFSATPSPFGHLIDLLTIDPMTAYYRLYIWNMVGPPILEHPWFGVLPADVDYEGSIDSVWLVLSGTYGMPCAILTGLSMIGACSLPTDVKQTGLTDSEARLGTVLGIVMFLIIFMGFTVHFWGSTWIFIGLLIGVRAHLGELGQLGERRVTEDEEEMEPAYS
jgi:hypothetical protein